MGSTPKTEVDKKYRKKLEKHSEIRYYLGNKIVQASQKNVKLEAWRK